MQKKKKKADGRKLTHLLLSTFIAGPLHRLSLFLFAGLCLFGVLDASRRTIEPCSHGAALSGVTEAIVPGRARRMSDTTHHRAGDDRSIIIIHFAWLQIGLLFSASDSARRSSERRQAGCYNYCESDTGERIDKPREEDKKRGAVG